MWNEAVGTRISEISSVIKAAAQRAETKTQGGTDGNHQFDPAGREPAEGSDQPFGTRVLGHLANLRISGALLRLHQTQSLLSKERFFAIRKPFPGGTTATNPSGRTKPISHLAEQGTAGSNGHPAHLPAAGSTSFLLPMRVEPEPNCQGIGAGSLHRLPHQTTCVKTDPTVFINFTKAMTWQKKTFVL